MSGPVSDISDANLDQLMHHILEIFPNFSCCQTDSLDALTNIEWQKGDYSGQQHVYKSRRLPRISADLFREARALHTEAMCWNNLRNFEHTISLCKWARELLELCGLSGGEMDCAIMNNQAEIHK
ncbi:hypothetical protein B0H14DRAFT_2596563 [Mycena olivaceomarginata]|nr:hypothetical protein B0H14DRAFT_2596563 [Mycena olivaceomarginata]